MAVGRDSAPVMGPAGRRRRTPVRRWASRGRVRHPATFSIANYRRPARVTFRARAEWRLRIELWLVALLVGGVFVWTCWLVRPA